MKTKKIGKPIKYEELYSDTNLELTKLIEYYKADPWKARVIFMDSKESDKYHTFRLGYFDRGNGDYAIVYFRKLYGINKNNRMYSNEKQIFSIVRSKGKYYNTFTNLSGKKQVRLATVMGLRPLPNYLIKIIVDKLRPTMPWLKIIGDTGLLLDVPFNTIIKEKLFDELTALEYVYKVNYRLAYEIHNITNNNIKDNLKYYWDNCINIDKFNLELINNTCVSEFYEALRLAKNSALKIDCTWDYTQLCTAISTMRLMIEKVLYTTINQDLTLISEFKAFQEYSNYKHINTIVDLYNLLCNTGNELRYLINSVSTNRFCVFEHQEYVIIIEKAYNNKLKIHNLYGELSLSKAILQTKVEKTIEEFNELIDGCSILNLHQYEYAGNDDLLNF